LHAAKAAVTEKTNEKNIKTLIRGIQGFGTFRIFLASTLPKLSLIWLFSIVFMQN